VSYRRERCGLRTRISAAMRKLEGTLIPRSSPKGRTAAQGLS
jgi:hypothetical protein